MRAITFLAVVLSATGIYVLCAHVCTLHCQQVIDSYMFGSHSVLQTQAIECVTSCGANGIITGQSNPISGCCGTSGGSGLGYEFTGEGGAIICQSCGDFNSE